MSKQSLVNCFAHPRPSHRFARRLSFFTLFSYLVLYLPVSIASEPIRVGIYQNPPKIFFSNGGRASGFFVDIVHTIAAKQGWQLEFISCHWEQCLQMLEAAEIDLLPDVAWSPKRAKQFDFNNEVALYNWSTIYRQRDKPIHSLADLDGRLIAVLTGSIQYEALKESSRLNNIQPIYVEVDTPDEILVLAEKREVDAVLLNRLYGQQQRQHIGLRPTHLIIEQSHLHFATTLGKHRELLDAIDNELRVMKQDNRSSYYQAMARWTEQTDGIWRLPRWFLLSLQVLALLFVILLITSIILRAIVRQRTAELEKRNATIIQSEKMFHAIYEHSPDAILLFNGKRFYDCNRMALSMFGYPDQTALSSIERDTLFPPQQSDGRDSSKLADDLISQAFSLGTQRFEWLFRRANGEAFPSEVALVPVETGSGKILQIIIRDISQRQAQQQALNNLTRAMQTLSQVNHALTHSLSEPLLLDDICHIIVEDGGYRMAWIAYADYDDARTLRPMAQAGFDQGYLESLQIHWQNDHYGQLPAAQAIRSSKPITVRDLTHQPQYVALHDEARHYSYHSCIALPLQRNNIMLGVLSIYSEDRQAFSDDEVLLLRQMAEDLAFGIQTQRLHTDRLDIVQERAEYQQQLQQAMEQTIQAFAVMLELRDPFTAGHQRRTAHLSIAIATEMGLDEQRVEGIRFGATLHDIGNIQVPAEILIRPGGLSDAEMALLRNHAVAGYEILRDISFPWPVARMVLNHHERMDGSGYPEGKKGEAIPLEARIIAVADVVEAMLSHRPYRGAHNIADTLQELRKQRGIALDAQVVDACLRLFEEKSYQLPI